MSASSTPAPLEYAQGPRAPDARWKWIWAVGVAVIFGYLLIYHLHHERQGHGHLGDFPTFYQAAQFARDHRDIYLAGQNPAQMYVYPPLIAFLYIPLTHLSLPDAASLMLLLTAAMLLGPMLLGARAMLDRFEVTHPAAVLAVACMVSFLCENEMRAEMTMLETDALTLLMFTLALFWLDRRPIWAGGALALALNIKYLPIIALPYLILRRRWKAAGGFVAGAIFFALIPAIQLGWRENLRCLSVALGGLLRWVGVQPHSAHSIIVHNIADGLSVSITSALGRVMGQHGYSNPQVLAVAAGVGLVALGIVALLYRVNGFSLWKWPPSAEQIAWPWKPLVALEWAGLIAVLLAFSPDTNARHLVLAMLVNIAGVVVLLAATNWAVRTPAMIGLGLILIGFIMPGTRPLRIHFGFNYFRFGIPCWFLMIGFLLILAAGLRCLAMARRPEPQVPPGYRIATPSV